VGLFNINIFVLCMDALRIFLKKLLGEIDKMIDRGECDAFSQEDLELLSTLLHPPSTMGRDEAAKFLGISLNKFHEYRSHPSAKTP
jgi:hypothetical protein